MELRRYLDILWRRALLIALTVAVAMAITGLRTNRTAVYSARTNLYIGASSFNLGNDPNDRLTADQSTVVNRIMLTFSAMIDSEPIAAAALEITGLPRSAASVVGSVQAGPLPATNLLTILVTDPDPSVAQTLANGVAEAFVQRIGTLEPGQPDEGGVPTAPVTIFERAKLPTVPQQVSLVPNLIVAALFGLLISSGLVLLAEYLDVTVKTAEEAERRLELPVLAVVPMLTLDPAATLRLATGRRRDERRDDIGLVRDA